MMENRWFGPYALFYWSLILLNLVVPQVLWIPKIRANTKWLFLISLVILVGMWLERFIIIITSLSRDFLPSSWGHYVATRWDYAVFFGTIGLLHRGDVYLHSHHAGHFDLRNAHPAAGGGGESEMSHTALSPAIYGLMAEFDTSTDLVEAARAAYAAGYRKMDAYSPFPIEEASEAIGFHKSRVPLVVLLGGLLGGLSGFALQYWINVIAYPLNIGGKPYDSWPAFIVPTFRNDDSVRRTFRRLRDVRLEWSAHAVPPAVQRGPILPGDPRQVLPVRGGGRSQVRHCGHATIYGESEAGVDCGGAALIGQLNLGSKR